MSQSNEKSAVATRSPQAGTGEQCCDWPGCVDQGQFKAPRSPQTLRDYYMFCLDHVRAYNKSWNFYGEMSADEVEAAVRADVTWNRPTWPMSTPHGDAEYVRIFGSGFDSIRDPFGFFENGPQSEPDRQRQVSRPMQQALRVLGLEAPVTVEDVKSQYKALVKRHHPDTNGGNPAAEERIKNINQAYETVMANLVSS